MRDIIAALLRSRGYTHDDDTDPDDMHWYGPTLGVRPILACVAAEMNHDLAKSQPYTAGWNHYDVGVASRIVVPSVA